MLNSNSTGRKVKEKRKGLSILCSLCLCKHKTCCISYHGFRTFLAWSCPVRKTTNSFFSIFCFLFEFKLEQKIAVLSFFLFGDLNEGFVQHCLRHDEWWLDVFLHCLFIWRSIIWHQQNTEQSQQTLLVLLNF